MLVKSTLNVHSYKYLLSGQCILPEWFDKRIILFGTVISGIQTFCTDMSLEPEVKRLSDDASDLTVFNFFLFLVLNAYVFTGTCQEFNASLMVS